MFLEELVKLGFARRFVKLKLYSPGLCSNAFAFASANANAAFALALAFDCPAADAFALAFAFDSSAFALALAFDSNAFDWNQMRNKCESNAKQMRIK